MLTTDGDNFFEGDGMFEKGMCLSLSYCLCYVEDISADKVEENMMEDTEPYPYGDDDFSISGDR